MRTKALLLLLLAATSIVACSAPRRLALPRFARPTPSLPPTEEPKPRPTVITPIQEPTAQSTAARHPTATPAEPSRIRFEPGETLVTLQGRLDDHATHDYVLYGREGQQMDVSIDALRQVGLTIWGADGIPLKRRVDEEMSWRGELPATQDVFIALSSIEATTYTLTVTILPHSPEASIEVIAPNGGETWLEGSTHAISWRSSGVEKVDVEVASGGKPWIVALGVDASFGQVLWDIRMGLVSDFGVASSDAMRVRVYKHDDPDLYDESDGAFTVRCPRIQFAPGAVSTTVTGTLDAAGGTYRYALRALAAQTMQIQVVPARIEVTVWGVEDGSTWQIPAGKSKLMIGSLPETQDYFFTLTNVSPADVVRYELEVGVR